jgi:biopolymer transport protein ExbD
MKVPSSRDTASTALEIQMTPMIDMVFLLIVFFVWTSGMQAVEMLLPSKVSQSQGSQTSTTETPPEADFDPVVIQIVIQGDRIAWNVNEQPLSSLAELRGLLLKLAAIKRDAPVILHPLPQVELGAVIDVYDLARVTGFEKIQFVAEAE